MVPGEYYRSSNFIPARGLAALAFQGVRAIAFGVVYGYATYFSPCFQFNFVLTLILAGAIVDGLRKAFLEGKVRNPLFGTIAGLAFGLMADYAAWMAWVLAATQHRSFVVR